jgi:hypothetical protein
MLSGKDESGASELSNLEFNLGGEIVLPFGKDIFVKVFL